MDGPTRGGASPTPTTDPDGPALEFEWPAVRVGVAEYEEGPTGCTVVRLPAGSTTAVDVRGGAPGTIGGYPFTGAICLAGGSLYGLEAASGVAAELFAERDFATGFRSIAAVSGAILYDFSGRQNAVYPDKALGVAATRAAVPGRFPLGRRGAGRSATCGGLFSPEPAGHGGAFRQVGDVRILAFVVLNSLGAVVDRSGWVVKGGPEPGGQRWTDVASSAEGRLPGGQAPPGNTALTVVITNQRLPLGSLTQFARQVHASMAGAIRPFHTAYDGDVLYAVTTGELEGESDAASLGIVASEVVWDAILSIP